MKKSAAHGGWLLPVILITVSFLIALSLILVNGAVFNLQTGKRQENAISALNVAEAGVNYYLWHLSHDNKDYKDGNATPSAEPYGPYVHEYKDQAGNVIGQYTLTIEPPPLGSNVATVESVGEITGSAQKRTIEAKLGIPSYAQYAFLTQAEAWFGNTETTTGPVHSNTGVHMDGTNNGVVSAGCTTYKPTSQFGGDGQDHNCVWGNGGPSSQWVFPVPDVDFAKVRADLKLIHDEATTSGIKIATSNSKGYLVELTTGNVIYISKVTAENDSDGGGITTTNRTSYAPPSNGVLYIDDNVWVKGQYDGRITIAAAHLPETTSKRRTIKIIDNLTYTAKDGTVAIGLIAQKDILVPAYSPQYLEIDASMLAQWGQVYRKEYSSNIRQSISVYGSISTYGLWTWSYVDSQTQQITSGYINTSQTYDTYLTLAPPPNFPTTGSFAVLSWKEK